MVKKRIKTEDVTLDHPDTLRPPMGKRKNSKKKVDKEGKSERRRSSKKDKSEKKLKTPKSAKKKKRKSRKGGNVPGESNPPFSSMAEGTENDIPATQTTYSLVSEEPWISNIGPEQPIVANFGPNEAPYLNDQDENDSSQNLPEEKSIYDEAGGPYRNSIDMFHDSKASTNGRFHDSKASMSGSFVIEEKPPIGELIVESEYSEHISEIGEIIADAQHGARNGKDTFTPDDKDVCFDDRGHPGTRVMTKIIRACLDKNEGAEYSSATGKLIKKKLKGRKFLTKTRRNGETFWQEASKSEISKLIKKWFFGERRRKDHNIEDDDSAYDSSLQDSAGNSDMPVSRRNIDKPRSELTPSARKSHDEMITPRASNHRSIGDNVFASPRSEILVEILETVMEECRNAEDYGLPYENLELQEKGVVAEKKLKYLLEKASTLAETEQNEMMKEQLQKMDHLLERVKRASVAPLLEMFEKIDLNLSDYLEVVDSQPADSNQEVKPGKYTESRLKGFSEEGNSEGYGDSNKDSLLVEDRMVPLKGYCEERLKGSSSDVGFQGSDEGFYSDSISFVSNDKPPSDLGSQTVHSEEESKYTEGSQSLNGNYDDSNDVRSTKSGRVLEIKRGGAYTDEMSSVSQSMPGLYGSDSSNNDQDFEFEPEELTKRQTDDNGSYFSDTSNSATREHRRIIQQSLPNPRVEQFFDRLQHFFEVRRKVEERADMMDPSAKFRNLKVKVTAGGIRKYNGKYKTEYQQTYRKDKIVRNLDDLYDAGESSRDALIKILDQMTDDVIGLDNESIEVPYLKPRDRAYEKAKAEYGDCRPGPPESWLYDVVRASVVVKSYKQMSDVNKWLGKKLHIVSSKNRFFEPVFNGYRDLLFHIRIPYRGELTYICEIQVHHKDIKALDLQFGLPKHYEFFRSSFSGPWRSQEDILDDLAMMNKFGNVAGKLMTKLLKSTDPDQLRLFAGLFREKLDEFDKALELYRRILILLEDKHGQDDKSSADTHLCIGLCLGAKGQINESLVHLQKALSIQEGVIGRNNINVAELLTEIGRMLSKQGDFEGALIKYEKALEIREVTFGREHFLVINSLQDIGQAFREMGDFMASEASYRKALMIQESVLGDIHPDAASTRHMIGVTLCQFGDFGKAMEEHRLALSIRETAVGKNHPTTAESHTDIGVVLCYKGDYEVAEWRHKKALRIREAVKGKDDEDCAISRCHLGDVLSRKGHYEGAIEQIKRAQEIREQRFGMDHPITAASYIDLGNIYYKKGDSGLALKEFRRAKVGREVLLGQRHPDTAVAYSCMGNAMNLQRSYEAALKMHEKALDIFEDMLGESHPLTATGYQNIADTLLLMGDKDDALIQHRKALSIRTNVLSKDHPDTALSCSRIGDLLAEKGDLIGALVAHRQCLAITVGLCGEDNTDSAKARIHVGLVLAAQGDFDDALEEFEQAISVLEALLGESHEETGRAYALVGSIHSARGDFDDALHMHTQALTIFEAVYGDDHPKTEAAMMKCQMAEDGETETEF
jgi:tetratricopeptide (TPR) repeat protein